MKPKFTLSERICSSLYFGIVATLSLTIIITETNFLTAVFAGGLCGGFFIPAFIMNPTEFGIKRALGAGALTTLVSALITALLIDIFYDNNLEFPDTVNYDLVGLMERAQRSLAFMGFAATFAVPYSLIGAPAALVLSHLLVKHRTKIAPEIEPDVFD
ncbi:hypothetical protein [Kiloniella sp. EL199]|uniref:hypothetical protein n=1 Tax=Kiloniella sp. EL199 TaxID=2107581 RepID=UPI000EA3093C|nr:hypothetical protein [Kiloniella sp. EL199]